jgi:hypothetical protein
MHQNQAGVGSPGLTPLTLDTMTLDQEAMLEGLRRPLLDLDQLPVRPGTKPGNSRSGNSRSSGSNDTKRLPGEGYGIELPDYNFFLE